MTIPEITAYVMALPVEELRRLTATEIMGWELKSIKTHNRIDLGPRPVYEDLYCVDGKPYQTVEGWRPDIDRNQSRMVTDKIEENPSIRWRWMEHLPYRQPSIYSSAGILLADIVPKWSPLDETRAALIAHMIHKETTNETDRDSYRS